MNKQTLVSLDSAIKYFGHDTKLAILTGAGASVESGIPHFRGKGGLWETYDPAEVATAEALRLRPGLVWEMHDGLRQLVSQHQPNPGHIALAKLEKILPKVTIITQNVDNYHQDAGSTNVLELHGNAWRVRCTAENKSWVDKTVPYDVLPPHCSCGAILRPDVVFFDEPLDQNIINSAFTLASEADIIFVIGTSCVVYPAAYIPFLAKQTGAILIEINLEPTPITALTDVSIICEFGIVMPRFVELLEQKIQN